MTETILTNAKVVTADACVLGSLVLAHGRIVAVDDKPSRAPGAVDLGGDYLLPGLVELHTDNLEKHFGPRPGVRWPARAAVVAHDAQVAAAGITTVFDAVALGDVKEDSDRLDGLTAMFGAVHDAQGAGMLRSDHFIHLRCEVSYDGAVELFQATADSPRVRLVSIMDHTPGQRQFVDVSKYRLYYQKKFQLNELEFEHFMAERRAAQARYSAAHRRAIVAGATARGLALASHDDATVEHVGESVADGMTVAEFPTTVAAARASHEHGLAVLMGAPNVVLGGSHSGNVGALDLARDGLVDILSSDYVPSSLLEAAFRVAGAGLGHDLPAAIRLVSRNPARSVGLADRGEITPGLRADLVRVADIGGHPVVRAVWVAGQRVA